MAWGSAYYDDPSNPDNPPQDPSETYPDPNAYLGQIDVSGLPNPFGGGKNTGITGGLAPSAAPAPAPAPAPSPSSTAPSPSFQPSGDPQTDFMRLASQYAPSARNLETFFPQFQAMYPGWTMKRNASGYVDSIIGPQGQIIDTQVNSGLDHSDSWQWDDGSGAQQQAAQAGAGGTASVQRPAGSDPGLLSTLTQSLLAQYGAAPTAARNSEMDQQVRAAILQMLGQGMETGLPDTSKSPQAAQFRLSSTREAERARSDAMEQRSANPGGILSGAAASDVEGINQARAEAQSRFEAGLTDQLLKERMTKLQTALSAGAGMLNAEDERALRAELASVDAAYQQNQMQLNWYRTDLQNQQFNDQLGFQIGSKEADLNAGAVGSFY